MSSTVNNFFNYTSPRLQQRARSEDYRRSIHVFEESIENLERRLEESQRLVQQLENEKWTLLQKSDLTAEERMRLVQINVDLDYLNTNINAQQLINKIADHKKHLQSHQKEYTAADRKAY